jgi:hypothetical protein
MHGTAQDTTVHDEAFLLFIPRKLQLQKLQKLPKNTNKTGWRRGAGVSNWLETGVLGGRCLPIN